MVQNTATGWSLVDGTAHLSSFTYQARIVDTAGNIGTTASQAVTIDTTAPAETLAITAIATDTGTPGDFITNDTTLTVSGTQRRARRPARRCRSAATTAPLGSMSRRSTARAGATSTATTHGTSFTYSARIVDLAANVGTTASQAITIDTTAPAETLTITAIATDTGSSRRTLSPTTPR